MEWIKCEYCQVDNQQERQMCNRCGAPLHHLNMAPWQVKPVPPGLGYNAWATRYRGISSKEAGSLYGLVFHQYEETPLATPYLVDDSPYFVDDFGYTWSGHARAYTTPYCPGTGDHCHAIRR